MGRSTRVGSQPAGRGTALSGEGAAPATTDPGATTGTEDVQSGLDAAQQIGEFGLGGLTLPGFDPAAVQAQEIHELMRKQVLTAAQTAGQLGTSSHAIHHILERVPLAQNLYQARLAGTKREELKRRLPRVALAQLARHSSQAETARRFSVSNHMVAALRKEYGLPAPPRGNHAVLATDP
ncbi:hypothetical protein [Streptomyces sp. NPDC054961]